MVAWKYWVVSQTSTSSAKTASLDASLSKVRTKTVFIGSLLQKNTNLKTASVNAQLAAAGSQVTRTKTATIGSLVKKAGRTKTLEMGALLINLSVVTDRRIAVSSENRTVRA